MKHPISFHLPPFRHPPQPNFWKEGHRLRSCLPLTALLSAAWLPTYISETAFSKVIGNVHMAKPTLSVNIRQASTASQALFPAGFDPHFAWHSPPWVLGPSCLKPADLMLSSEAVPSLSFSDFLSMEVPSCPPSLCFFFHFP